MQLVRARDSLSAQVPHVRLARGISRSAAPESGIGGSLAAVRTGDEVQLDVPNRKIELCLPEDEIRRRLDAFRAAPPKYDRGYGKLFLEHVTQANLGCDFDFLRRV